MRIKNYRGRTIERIIRRSLVGYGQTQSEMNRAAIVDLKSAKDELTRVYQKVFSATPRDQRPTLY